MHPHTHMHTVVAPHNGFFCIIPSFQVCLGMHCSVAIACWLYTIFV